MKVDNCVASFTSFKGYQLFTFVIENERRCFVINLKILRVFRTTFVKLNIKILGGKDILMTTGSLFISYESV